MQHQEAFRAVMYGQFKVVKLRNPGFSLRAFSKRVGLSSSAVSEIFSGKRKVSRRLAERVLLALQQDAEVIQGVLAAFDQVEKAKHTARTDYHPLSIDTYAVMSEWYHFAILNLIETTDFVSNSEWIAKRLGLDVSVIEAAMNRMVALGLVRWEDGHLSRTEKRLTTTDDVANAALRKAQKQNLQLASAALDDIALENRDITALTLAVNMNQIPQAKRIIRRFLDEVGGCLETGQTSEVYKLSVALFPLTKLSSSGENNE